MKAFVLNIPDNQVEKVKEEVEKQGFMAMPNANGSGLVVLCDALPKSLNKYLPQNVLNEDNLEKKVSKTKVEKRVFALDVPFEYRNVVSKVGARWDSQLKGWFYEGEQLPDILKSLEAKSFSWEDAIAKAKMGIRSTGFAGEDPYILNPHQHEAKTIIAKAAKCGVPGFLLADDVGLGKTLSAWEGVREVCKVLSIKTIVIVCPLSVQAHWRETIRRQGSDVGQIVILNYERLNKLFSLDSDVKVKSKKGLARRASATEVDLLIFDESHKLKNPTSARSKLSQKLVEKAKFSLWLSATAGQTPLELSYLAPILAKATNSKAKSLNDFEQWCKSMGFKLKRGAFGAWEWVEDKEDCERLANLLFKSNPVIGLRRRPQDIAGWPEMSRILFPVELNAQERVLYNESWDNFKKYLKAEGGSVNQKENSRIKGKKVSLNALVEALRFRQKSSLLRVRQTFEFAMDLLEDGIKPAISCAFSQTVAELKELFEKAALKVSVIDGSLSAQEREQQRLDFQKGKSQVAIFTIEEGISLHEGEFENVARSLLIHDLRWSAIQMAQIEGRTHRNGKFSQAYWLLSENTIEEKIAKKVAQRAVFMKAMSGEVDENLEKEILQELLKNGE